EGTVLWRPCPYAAQNEVTDAPEVGDGPRNYDPGTRRGPTEPGPGNHRARRARAPWRGPGRIPHGDGLWPRRERARRRGRSPHLRSEGALALRPGHRAHRRTLRPRP